MQDIINESIRYWEPRRLVYNAVLAIVVVGFAWYHQMSPFDWTWQIVAGLLVMAMIANVLYCAAYVVDLFVQLSDCQQIWKRYRWAVWLVGTVLAIGIFWITRD